MELHCPGQELGLVPVAEPAATLAHPLRFSPGCQALCPPEALELGPLPGCCWGCSPWGTCTMPNGQPGHRVPRAARPASGSGAATAAEAARPRRVRHACPEQAGLAAATAGTSAAPRAARAPAPRLRRAAEIRSRERFPELGAQGDLRSGGLSRTWAGPGARQPTHFAPWPPPTRPALNTPWPSLKYPLACRRPRGPPPWSRVQSRPGGSPLGDLLQSGDSCALGEGGVSVLGVSLRLPWCDGWLWSLL